MKFNFKTSTEVYDYVSVTSSHAPDAWASSMIEAYIEDMDGEPLDTKELYEWLEDELTEIEDGYKEFIDNHWVVCYNEDTTNGEGYVWS